MEHLPFYIALVMGLSTFLCVFFLAKASPYYITRILIIASVWLVLQALVSASGFYADTKAMPPRLLLAIVPPILLIIGLFATKGGRRFIDKLDLKTLTLLHIVRIPVELVLFWLYLYKKVPEIMTFEGQNFDIISGITAPAWVLCLCGILCVLFYSLISFLLLFYRLLLLFSNLVLSSQISQFYIFLLFGCLAVLCR